MTITEPGVYDIPDAEYHQDPVPGGSLSHSGAKRLLPPSCPALFDHWRRYGQQPNEAFDLGHAAHKLVLGVGLDIRVIDAADWKTKKAQDARKAAYAEGAVPLLADDWRRVHDMADALRRHPIASALLDPDLGKPEVSLFWTDTETDVARRARLDWLRPGSGSARTIVVDYKSTNDAEPDACAKVMHNYRYHSQGDYYLDGVVTLGLGDPDTAFVLIFQEKDPPHLVTVAEPDSVALRIGRDLNRRALQTYAECSAAGEWPGYTEDVLSLSLPAWVERRYLEDTL